jgi:hypothetical protein
MSLRGEQGIGGPEQGVSNAERGIKAAHQRALSRVNQSAVYNAIMAIFAAFGRFRPPGQ